MVNVTNNLLDAARSLTSSSSSAKAAADAPSGSTFSDMLKNSIDEVSKLQQDASQAVENLTTGKTQDVTGVMTAVEKSDLAFKTLLTIRAKLMEAYDEIKGMPM